MMYYLAKFYASLDEKIQRMSPFDLYLCLVVIQFVVTFILCLFHSVFNFAEARKSCDNFSV